MPDSKKALRDAVTYLEPLTRVHGDPEVRRRCRHAIDLISETLVGEASTGEVSPNRVTTATANLARTITDALAQIAIYRGEPPHDLMTQLIAEIHCAFDGFGSAMATKNNAP